MLNVRRINTKALVYVHGGKKRNCERAADACIGLRQPFFCTTGSNTDSARSRSFGGKWLLRSLMNLAGVPIDSFVGGDKFRMFDR